VIDYEFDIKDPTTLLDNKHLLDQFRHRVIDEQQAFRAASQDYPMRETWRKAWKDAEALTNAYFSEVLRRMNDNNGRR
jgi:hypothetical protein